MQGTTGLIVSLKDVAGIDSAKIPQAFRQIEQWANNPQWHVLPLDASWGAVSNRLLPQWCIDALGWVNLRGMAQYTGTLANGSAIAMATMPTNLWPVQNEDWTASIGPTAGIGLNRVELLKATGIIQIINQSGGSQTNPFCNLANVRYAPWK